MSDLRQKLKTATQPMHDRVEASNVMSRLMRDELTEAEYAETLARLHALYQPVEAALAGVAGLRERLPDLDQRFKLGSLRADLAALGVTPPAPREIPAVTSVPQAFGTLYVLEGSTMGGRLIARSLRQRPFAAREVTRFFEHYGADAGKFWQTFVRALEGLDLRDHDLVIASALNTFALFL